MNELPLLTVTADPPPIVSNDGQKARGRRIYTTPRPFHQCMDDEDASEGRGSLRKHTQAWQKQREEDSK